MQPEQNVSVPPTSTPKTPFWKRLGPRLLIGIGLPLLTLIGVLTFAYVQERRATSDRANTQSQAQQQETAQAAKPIDTPAGRRYASIQAAADLDKTNTLGEAHSILQGFLDQYDLTLHTTSIEPSSYVKEHDTFKTLEEKDIDAFRAYAKIFIDEWAKYPRDWVKESNLKHVMIVKNLAVGDTERAATPDPVGDAVYYDIGYGADLYAREVIHHEYNHQIEYEHFSTYARQDPSWLALNPSGFTYNPKGGVAAYHEDDFTNDAHPEKGFVNRYAMYALEEDRAEVYAYLMTRDYYHDLKSWIKTDEKLAQKVQLYKDFIKRISPTMDGDYFDAINP